MLNRKGFRDFTLKWKLAFRGVEKRDILRHHQLFFLLSSRKKVLSGDEALKSTCDE
jgi:hypothetical protein